MNKAVCSVPNCTNIVHGKGYCPKHYRQITRHGKVFTTTIRDLNEIVDKGTYYEVILTDKKMNETGRAKIDKEDLEKIQAIGRWCLNVDGYVENSYNNIYMHRLIIDAPKGYEVDHKKSDKRYRRDNRKKNLRVATKAENTYNIGKRSNNTSGYKGVTWSKNRKKWFAQIRANGEYKGLGYFLSAEEAYEAYCKAAKKLHKDFANVD